MCFPGFPPSLRSVTAERHCGVVFLHISIQMSTDYYVRTKHHLPRYALILLGPGSLPIFSQYFLIIIKTTQRPISSTRWHARSIGPSTVGVYSMIEAILQQKGPKLPQTKALSREATYSQYQIDHVGPLTCIFMVPRLGFYYGPTLQFLPTWTTYHNTQTSVNLTVRGGGGRWVLFPTPKPVFMANIDDADWFIAKTWING